MRATMDTLDVIEPVQVLTDARAYAPSVHRGKQQPAALRRQKQEKWASSLDPQDLRCLLAVLETSLIPQLVRGYAPSGAAPLPNNE